METTIRMASNADVNVVADLVHKLLSELRPPTSPPPNLNSVRRSASSVLDPVVGVWAFLAEDERGGPLGILTLNECASIYAGGKFGVISELYIEPQFRSAGVGPRLLNAAIAFGRSRQWGRLEVGAPSVPRWNRTVSFYRANQFEEVGPRLRRML